MILFVDYFLNDLHPLSKIELKFNTVNRRNKLNRRT